VSVATPERRRLEGRWVPSPAKAVAVAYVTSIFMTGVDMQTVNVALPTLAEEFGAPVIPASGWIGDRVGTKRTFLFSLALFTFASALCGAAQSLPELIAARALQSVGGVLTQWLSWRWVFFINLPVGIVMLVFAYLFVAEHRPAPSGRLDVRGLLTSGVGLSALLYAISEGSVLGWTSPDVVVAGVGGIGLLWLFAHQALRRPDPILRLRLLRDPLLRSTNIVFALTTAVFLGSLYLTPIFLQQVLHQSSIGSGTSSRRSASASARRRSAGSTRASARG
jgi:MFS family permease